MENNIKKTLELLNNDLEWEERYAKYITYLEGKQSKGFKKPEGLSVYSSISKYKGSTYDLRYDGQSVGLVVSRQDKISLRPQKEANLKYFNDSFIKDKEEVDWHSKEATEFRRYFRDHAKNSSKFNLKSSEHRVENRLLREFAKKTRAENKSLTNIQPITLNGCFFQLPTPLKASNHAPSYAKQYGGGIDILSRIKINGKSRICVMEVKDENKDSESQAQAMEQALTYATFIATLLKSKSGQEWWDFFMGRGSKTRKMSTLLDIDVVTIMPKGNSEEFADKQIRFPNLATFHCHSLYYDDSVFNKGLGEFKFSGSFLEHWK